MRLRRALLRPGLTRILVALLLLQWGTAFAHCLTLAAPAAPLQIEICTADGLVSMALHGETPAGGHDHGGTGGAPCPACLGPAAAALPAPAIALAPPVVLVQAADPPPPAPPVPAPPSSCRPPPRAPPTS